MEMEIRRSRLRKSITFFLCLVLIVLTINLLVKPVFSSPDIFKSWIKKQAVITVGSGWESNQVRQLGGIIVSGRLHVWYGGIGGSPVTDRIGYAYSDDMLSFTKGSYNPIINVGTSGEWDDDGVRDPSIAKRDATYYIYYQGYDGSNWRIGAYTTTDPDNSSSYYTDQGLLIDLGSSGQFDDNMVASPAVLQDDFSVVTLYYEARKARDRSFRIAYANSSDGITFTKQGPIKNMAGDDFLNPYNITYMLVPVTVVIVDSIYYMFLHYRNAAGQIVSGVLNSTNKINWAWYATEITEVGAESPMVILDTLGKYRMYCAEDGWKNLNLWVETPATIDIIGLQTYVLLVSIGGFLLLGAAFLVGVAAFIYDEKWLLIITIGLTILGTLTIINLYITPIF